MSDPLYAAYVAGWQAHRFCAHRRTVEQCWALDGKYLASADTHPKGGDVEQAPSPMGSAVGNAETPKPTNLSSQPSKG